MPSSKPRRSPGPQERQRDPERTRALILDAAAAEFGAHGYAGARISAIATRAGVNQQLISYYFDGKEGLYKAISQQWRERQRELAPPELSLPEQMRNFALEAARNPAAARLLAWSGLEYTGAEADSERDARTGMFAPAIERLRALQESGGLSAELDPAVLLVMLMAAAMAPTTLPQVIAGIDGGDPSSPEVIERFADQIAVLGRLLGLESA